MAAWAGSRQLEAPSCLPCAPAGSVFLGALAAAPALVESLTGLQAFRGFAGTSVLILVGVATDTARRFRSELAMQKYKVRWCAPLSCAEGGPRHGPPALSCVQDIDRLYDDLR